MQKHRKPCSPLNERADRRAVQPNDHVTFPVTGHSPISGFCGTLADHHLGSDERLPVCRVSKESCPGSQYWGRRFSAAGHEVRIIPAPFVKPYVKSNKNDYNDAEAIAEAGSRGTMRCVPLKNAEQLELQATHRVRQRLIIDRSAVVNQMRALLLENGIAVPIGRALLARRLPEILENAENALSVRLRSLLERLRTRWLSLDVEIVEMTALLTVNRPGISGGSVV